MSQKKVDKYKEEKANRGKIIKKEKRMIRLEKTAAVLVLVAIIGWLGYSVYGQVQKSGEAKVTETVMDASAIDEYMMGLNPDDAES